MIRALLKASADTVNFCNAAKRGLSFHCPSRTDGNGNRNAAEGRDIDLIVVTDAEAILGIGDWGTNGVSISVGKLMVYTAAAGLDPARVLPVVLDAGTNRESLLQDPLYLGLHEKRVTGTAYDDFVDRFVALVEGMFPHLYLHFEDFGRSHAAKILNRYVDRYPVFNDDIEGTGIISLPVSWAPSGFPVRPSRTRPICALALGRPAAALPIGFTRKCSTRVLRKRKPVRNSTLLIGRACFLKIWMT